MAQYFSVEYAGYYKYVCDLRGPELKTYVLYQARAAARLARASLARADRATRSRAPWRRLRAGTVLTQRPEREYA